MPLILSAQRALLLVLVLAGAGFQLSDEPSPSGRQTVPVLRTILVDAGFRVDESKESWMNDEIKGRSFFVGKHPLCRSPISISLVGLDERSPDGSHDGRIYIYDDWEGPLPPRLAVLWRAARLELRSLLSFGRVPKPPRRMVAVNDTSACLSLTTPSWRKLWGSS